MKQSKSNRVLSRECVGQSIQAFPRTQETTIQKDITRLSTQKSDCFLQPKIEKLYTVSKKKFWRWLWLRSWASYCKIQAKIEESRKNHYPHGSAGKESALNVGDLGSIPGLGRSPGEGNGYPHRYSGLENSMDYTVQEITKSWAQLSDFHFQTSNIHN